jgi:hypothetical protein
MNPLTLAQLSAAKCLSTEFLAGLGLHDTERGVAMPYHDTAGRAMFERTRLALAGKKRFLQPAGISLAPYGLERLEHARTAKYLVLPEGESDSWTLWYNDFPALGLPGASTARTLQAEQLAGIERVFVHREHDSAGSAFVKTVAMQLREIGFAGEVYEVSTRFKDPSELYCDSPARFRDRFQAALNHASVLNLDAHNGGPEKKWTTLEFVTLSTVRSEPLQWVWPGHIPAGKLTEFIGDPGYGKTLSVIDIGARVSTGSPFPDGASGCEPADVLLASGEDDVRDTLRPRAEAASANLARIHVLTTPLLLPDDVVALKAEIDKHAAKLVILDPLDSFLAKGIDSNKSSDVRGALSKLKDLAAATGTAIVIVRHLNKDSKITNALYRGGGSIGYTAASRASFLVAADPSDPDARILAPVKCNLALKPKALKFRTVKYALADAIDTQKIEWLGSIDISANDLLQAQASGPRGPRPDKTEAAKELVRVALADGEQHASRPIIEDAKQQGISFGTLSNAAKSLGVRKQKGGFEGGWAWSLPQPSANGASTDNAHRNGTVVEEEGEL